MSVNEIAASLLQRAELVRQDQNRRCDMSAAEQIAVALVLNRADLLDRGTILESVERLGPEWTRAALLAQRAMDAG